MPEFDETIVSHRPPVEAEAGEMNSIQHTIHFGAMLEWSFRLLVSTLLLGSMAASGWLFGQVIRLDRDFAITTRITLENKQAIESHRAAMDVMMRQAARTEAVLDSLAAQVERALKELGR